MHMPSFVGAYKAVNNTGTINNGDAFIIGPTTALKNYYGSGSVVTGDLSTTFTLFSATIVNDPDVIDDSIAKVATIT